MMNTEVGSESSLLAITSSSPPPLGEPEWRMGPYLRLISTSQILFLGGLAGKPSEGSTQ